MTRKTNNTIPLSRRVVPSIIAHDIKGVSPMIGPIETKRIITERQGEGQVAVDPETGHRTWKIDVGDLSAEQASEIVDDVLKLT
jgi:hypothetical protein